MKKNKLKLFVPIVLIIISFGLGSYLYPILPQNMASHWRISGQVDGYSSKNFGVFFLPVLLICLLALFLVLPKTDPYKTNFSQFKKFYENFINIVFVFLVYLYSLTLVWNLGYRFNLVQFITPGFGLIFYYAGVLMQNTKRNWFVGIRTPWTLSNEVVWEKTHKLGARLFKASGLISLLGIVLPSYALLFILAPILLVTVFVFVYSYLEFQKINNK